CARVGRYNYNYVIDYW
nr:immunoglobulin heavy chain junction region [Macaca mulatta]MOV38298.1 immunoglobulin heavy chain junction region [Macaca mulatta]MOV38427.1 immunoglobulin heavy chain junction region [Macaca mulatta]MOV38702.1 immunoglobulin heavy chain junction region [Macaca mulatta]MOV38890.1 immunoglobulin heavy chain junction region [Macaca mulatta]